MREKCDDLVLGAPLSCVAVPVSREVEESERVLTVPEESDCETAVTAADG